LLLSLSLSLLSKLSLAAALVLVGGFFASSANAAISTLTLTSPNGGERLGGGPVDITWTQVGGTSGDLVDITLIDDVLGSSHEIAINVPFDASPYAWTGLPSEVAGPNYKIKVLKAGTSTVYDTSDAVFTIDNTSPTITSLATLDTDGNGNVDQLDLTFSEPVRDVSFLAAGFTIDGQPGTSINTGVTANDNSFSVLFSGVIGTGEKSVTYTAGTGTDMATPGNLLATNTQTATDLAAPVFISARTLTTTTIRATFSEDVMNVNLSGNEFTVVGHTVSGASELNGVVTLVLLTPIGTGETPDVTFDTDDFFRDIALNQAIDPTTLTPSDGVAPVLLEITPVTTPTMDDTPDYTFSSSEPGTISYDGGCSSATTAAVESDNLITFDTLTDGTYNTCTISVIDSSGNESSLLLVSFFQVDATPVAVTDITSEPGALTIDTTTFSPALGSSLLRTDQAFYAVRATSIVAQSISNVQWRITIEGPAGFTPDMVDLDEVGWSDIGPNPDSTTIFHYPFVGSGTLVAIGSCTDPDPVHDNSCVTDSFDIDSTDDFKNVDRVNFASTAPLGTYTIKRVLVLADATPVSNELDVATFTVTNNRPVLEDIDDKIVDELTELAFQATASDVEVSALTFTLEDAPAGASITPDGTFTWTSTEEQGGNPSADYSFTVIVTDADGGTDSRLVNVTVNEVNVAPVATDSSVSTDEDIPLLITLPATDADIPVNTLTYSIVTGLNCNCGILGTVVGNQVTFMPDLNVSTTTAMFTFKTNDGLVDSNESQVNIVVNPVNDVPILDSIPVQTVIAGNDLNFTASATDVDGDTLNFTLTGNSAGSSIDSLTGLFSWTPTISGVYLFDVVVSDGNGGTDSQTVQVTVNHAAIAKIVISAEPTTLSVENQSTISVVGKDQFDNVATSDNSTIVVLSADNGGSLGTALLTLSNGLAGTTLSKSSAGDVHVNASSGILTPSQVTVTFNAVPGDETAPTILSHNPADDSTSVSVGVTPFLVFSEPLKSSTVNSANIQLKKYDDDSAVPATVSLVEGGTQVNIDLTSPLENDTQYYFAVSAGLQDEVGNAFANVLDTSTKAGHEFTTAELAGIVLDDVSLPSIGTANNTYLGGWHYIFRITVNDPAETNLSMKFTDWMNTEDSEETVPVFDNTRLLLNAGAGVGLTEADIEAGFSLGNEYEDQTPGPVDIGAVDINPDRAGRQVQFDIFVKLPEDTAPGFYTTDFVIRTETP